MQWLRRELGPAFTARRPRHYLSLGRPVPYMDEVVVWARACAVPDQDTRGPAVTFNTWEITVTTCCNPIPSRSQAGAFELPTPAEYSRAAKVHLTEVGTIASLIHGRLRKEFGMDATHTPGSADPASSGEMGCYSTDLSVRLRWVPNAGYC